MLSGRCACDRTGILPCRRMSSQLTPADRTDERTTQQDNELEALASIFGDDFQDLRNSDPWKVTRAGAISAAGVCANVVGAVGAFTVTVCVCVFAG